MSLVSGNLVVGLQYRGVSRDDDRKGPAPGWLRPERRVTCEGPVVGVRARVITDIGYWNDNGKRRIILVSPSNALDILCALSLLSIFDQPVH